MSSNQIIEKPEKKSSVHSPICLLEFKTSYYYPYLKTNTTFFDHG